MGYFVGYHSAEHNACPGGPDRKSVWPRHFEGQSLKAGSKGAELGTEVHKKQENRVRNRDSKEAREQVGYRGSKEAREQVRNKDWKEAGQQDQK